jgi:hypothetical protein
MASRISQRAFALTGDEWSVETSAKWQARQGFSLLVKNTAFENKSACSQTKFRDMADSRRLISVFVHNFHQPFALTYPLIKRARYARIAH